MKHIVTLAILLAAFMQPVFAEKGGHGKHMDHGEKHMDRMIEGLQLNGEQEPAVRQILEEQHSKLRNEMQAIHEQMRPKMEALKAETSERLSSVLTEEQLQSFNSQMEERHNKMRDLPPLLPLLL
jgi:Spy/CpxP family protein refolding chaperone